MEALPRCAFRLRPRRHRAKTIAIAPGVHWLRMPLPFALDHINLWLVEDGAGWTIVDTGYAMAETKALWQRIFAERLGGLPVTRIIVTHYHPDHIGLAGWLCERWQAPLWTTEKEWLHARVMSQGGDDFVPARREFARRAGMDAASSALFGEHGAGYRRGVPSVPPSFQRIADGHANRDRRARLAGDRRRRPCPRARLPLLRQGGVLIAGDQVLPEISPNVSVQAHEPDGDPLARYLASLARLRAAVPAETLVLPSHNLPFFGLHDAH